MSFARKVFGKKEKPAQKLKRQQEVLTPLKVQHLLDKHDYSSEVVTIDFGSKESDPPKTPAKGKGQQGYEAKVIAFDDAIKQLEAQVPPAGKDELYPGPVPKFPILDTLKAKKKEAEDKLTSKPPVEAEYVAAFTVLANVNLQDAATSAQKQLTAISETTKKMADYKAKYIERITRLDAALTELKDYVPASDEQVKKFTEHRAAAQALVQAWPPAYDKGLKELEKVTIGTAVKTANAAWEKLAKSVHGDKKGGGQEVYAQIDALRADYEKTKKSLMTPAAQAETEAALDEQERALLKAKGDSSGIRAVGVEVAALKQKIADAYKLVEKNYAEYLRLRAELETAIAHLSDANKDDVPIASEDEIAIARKCLADGRSLATSTHELVAAGEMFKEGITLCETLRDTNGKLREQWARQVVLRDRVLGMLVALKASECPAVRSEAIDLYDSLREEQDKGLKIGRDVTLKSVIEKISAGDAKFHDLEQQNNAWINFKDALAAAEDEVAKKLAAVATALAELAKEIGDGPYKHASLTFVARQDGARKGWDERVKKATGEDGLDKAKTLAELDELIEDIKALTGNGEKLAAQVNLGMLEEWKAKYDVARKAAKQKVDDFAAYDALVALQHMKMLKAEDVALESKATAGGYMAAIEKVERIGEDAAKRMAFQKAEMESVRADFAAVSLELTGILQAIFDKAAKETDVKQRKFHLDLRGTLQASYDQVAALGTSDQISLVRQALSEAQALRSEVLSAQKEINGGVFDDLIGDKAIFSYREANKKLVKIKGILGQQFVQTYRYESAFALNEKVTKLEKALGGRTLSKLGEEIAELLAAADKVAGEAKADSHKCKMFDDKVDTLKPRLETGFFKEAPSFLKEIEAEIARIKSVAHYEGGLVTAEKFYADLVKRLDDLQAPALPGAEEGPGDRLEREEATAEAKRAKEKATRATFEANCALMKKKIEATEMGKAEKKALLNAVDDAEKTAKKDLETARDQLQAVRTRFQLVESNPEGLLMHARKQLPSCELRWRGAVKNYVDALLSLKSSIGGLVTANQLTADAQKEVVKQIDAVTALFNPMIFAAVTKGFVNAVDDKARAGVRERGLTEVRRLSGILLGDFRLQVLAGCPFIPMNGLQSELNLALLDYENNLLVSM
jgi:hypothetical protein